MKKKKFSPRVTRRQMLKIGFIGGGAMFLPWKFKLPKAFAQIPGGTLHPAAVPKYQTPMLIPPVMPKAGTIKQQGGKNVDYYEISMQQFPQQILPAGLPATTVWGYGAVTARQQEGAAAAQRAFADDRGQAEQAGAGQVDQRSGGCQRQLPAAPAAGGPDAALGQPARRHSRSRHAAGLHRPTHPGPTPARCPWSPTCTARSAWATKATAMPKPGTCPRRTTSRRLRHRRHLVRFLRRQGGRRIRRNLGTRLRHVPVSERQPGLDDLVPRPRAGHDPAERVCRPGRLLHHPRWPGRRRCSIARRACRPCCPAPRPKRTTSSRPTRPTTRSRSPSRTAPSTPTARSSTRTRASSSTGSSATLSLTASSRRSGTPSSSAT